MKIKKALKITGIIVLLLVAILVAAPFLFKSNIEDYIKNQINSSVNADVDFAEVDLSFFKNFPNASVTVSEIKITNREPFLGDTLLLAKEVNAKMSLKELTKIGKDVVTIDAFTIKEAYLNLMVNEAGITNYDIAKKEKALDDKQKKTSENNLQLDVSEYGILNSKIYYTDEGSKTKLQIIDFNHVGSGDLANDIVDLDTETSMLVSLDQKNTNYLTNYNVTLDAIVNVDNKQQKYTFKENKLLVNRLELVFDGFLQNFQDRQEVDLNFKTPSTSFKNFIALIPSAYSNNIENVDTEGNFEIKGFAKGALSETTIPNFVIDVVSNNASVKYPDLPKRIKDINLRTTLANITGNTEDTYLDINKLSFRIDQDVFNASSTIKQLTGNPLVDAKLDGVLNLANISKAYPVKLENELQGILKANLNTRFDMESVKKQQYQNIYNQGNFSIKDFVYSSKDIVNPINVSKALVNFGNRRISLEEFKATTGKSDLSATGTIDNLLGFLFNSQELKGDFKVDSNMFVMDDFMVDNADDTDASATTKTTKTGEALKIPSFLNTSIQANVKTVIYDNLELNNVNGNLLIQDETATLKNMSTNIFDGTLAINGKVSTKNDKNTFAMDLGIDKFDISKSFNGLELFQSLSPVAKALQGKLNTRLKLMGNLDNEFGPELNTLTGTALAEVLTAKVSPKQAKALALLDSKLDFIDLSKLDLKDLKTALTFEDGKVNVKPFTIKYEDIDIELAGAHGFNNEMNYTATFDVPAKYLGSEVSNLLSKIGEKSIEETKVPVIANITGNVNSPNVKTDLKESVKKLTTELIEIQKKKLLGKLKDKGGDLLGGLFGNKKDQDSTATQQDNKPDVGSIIDGIIGGNNKPNDSTTNNNDKPDVKDILGGLLGKKKKKEEKQKDTINN